MESQLSKISDKFKRIKGFDGYKIKNTQGDTIDGISFLNYYSDMTKGEIGCTMSHLLAIKNAYDNQESIVIISEDDTSFMLLPFIDKKIETIIDEAPEGWEILQLFTFGNSNNERAYKYIRNIKGSRSTICYVINTKGMEKILDHAYQRDQNLFKIYPKEKNNFDVPSEGVADIFIYDLATTYILQPCIVFPYNTTLASTIHDDHTPHHLETAFEILKSHDNRRNKLQVEENIDKIFVINLDHRQDRLKEFLVEFKKMGYPEDKLERFSGILDKGNPPLGCLKSHLSILKIARDRGYKKIIIFEDDFEFILEDSLDLYNNLNDFFSRKLDFKVLMLSYNIMEPPKPIDDLVGITRNVQTASGYLVNMDYSHELIDYLEYGREMLEKEGETLKHLYANDQIWKKTQQDDKWYYFIDRVGKQRKSYSNIEGQIVNYEV
jgi:GR25 family glycosyltransferase involved in LPS biosynthesis